MSEGDGRLTFEQENAFLKGQISQLELKLAAAELPQGDWWKLVEKAMLAVSVNWKELMSLLVHDRFQAGTLYAECVNLRELLFVEQQTNRELVKELAEAKAGVPVVGIIGRPESSGLRGNYAGSLQPIKKGESDGEER